MYDTSPYLVNGRDRAIELATVFGVFAGVTAVVLVVILGLDQLWMGVGLDSKAIVNIAKASADPLLFLISTTVWLSVLLLYIWFPVFESFVQTVGLQVESALYIILGSGFGGGIVLAFIAHHTDVLAWSLFVLAVSAGISAVLRIKTVENDLRQSLVLRVMMSAGVLVMIGLAVALTKNAAACVCD